MHDDGSLSPPGTGRTSQAPEYGREDHGKIDELAASPEAQANNVTRLHGRPESRLRVGDFRVVFIHEARELVIIDIAPRGNVYD